MIVPSPPQPHATFDFETFSAAGLFLRDGKYVSMHGSTAKGDKGLAGVGTENYARHPTTEVLTLSYRLPGGPLRRWRPGLPLPQDLFEWLASGGLLEAHNVMFERMIWTFVCVPKYGFPALPVAQLRCSMAKARVNAFPGALGALTEVLATPVVKDKDGRRLLDKFSVPRKPTKTDPRLRIHPEDDPEDAERLYHYCDVDVESEELVSGAMPDMSPSELAFWQIDQEINWRGVGVDIESVRAMRVILELTLETYGEEFAQITGGLSPSQPAAVTGWLHAKGVSMPSFDKEAVEEALKRSDLPADCRRVLEIRQLTGSASVKKLYSLEREATADARLKNLFVHHGGRTGRAAGNGPQPQNLPKAGPDLKWCRCGQPSGAHNMFCAWCYSLLGPKVHAWDEPAPEGARNQVDAVTEIMGTLSLELVEWFFGDALLAITGCIRGMFVAGQGMDLIASDFTAIEAVVAACLAGEQWRIDVFKEGRPIYLESASRITGTSVAVYLAYAKDNGKHHPDRNKIGKVAELACFSPQTQVLTNSGYKSIISVSEDDLLWDGVEWVKSQGVVSRGIQKTVNLDGVKMTPTHKVLCGTSWLEASRLVSNESTLTLGLETGSENLPSWAQPRAAAKALGPPLSVRAEPNPTRWTTAVSETAEALAAINVPRENPALLKPSTSGSTQMYARTKNTVGGSSTEFPRAYLDATTLKTRGLKTTADGGSRFMSRGAQADGIFSHIWSHLMGGTARSLNWIVSRSTGTTNRVIFDLSPRPATNSTGVQSETSNNELTNWSDVYDIAHAGPRNRFTIRTDSGHLIVHNCGFGGWIGALKAFSEDIDEEEAKTIILGWREASPAIVEMWGGQGRGWPGGRSYRKEYFGLEGIFVQAVLYPSRTFHYKAISAYMKGDALVLRLPSGREMVYQSPRLSPSPRREGEYAITYATWNTNPKYGPVNKWVPMSTYSGKIFENVVQATAHDILREAIIRLRAAGYPCVLHVHDEIVVEVPEGWGSVEEMEALMAQRPTWAADWPISVDGGYRAKRYRK